MKQLLLALLVITCAPVFAMDTAEPGHVRLAIINNTGSTVLFNIRRTKLPEFLLTKTFSKEIPDGRNLPPFKEIFFNWPDYGRLSHDKQMFITYLTARLERGDLDPLDLYQGFIEAPIIATDEAATYCGKDRVDRYYAITVDLGNLRKSVEKGSHE